MKTERTFISDGDRYSIDFGYCSVRNGWAQVDTGQDAWYFGTWTNPTTRSIITYAEGDVTAETAETDAEYVSALEHIRDWNEEHGHGFKGIDPGLGEELRTACIARGIGHLLH